MSTRINLQSTNYIDIYLCSTSSKNLDQENIRWKVTYLKVLLLYVTSGFESKLSKDLGFLPKMSSYGP